MLKSFEAKILEEVKMYKYLRPPPNLQPKNSFVNNIFHVICRRERFRKMLIEQILRYISESKLPSLLRFDILIVYQSMNFQTVDKRR